MGVACHVDTPSSLLPYWSEYEGEWRGHVTGMVCQVGNGWVGHDEVMKCKWNAKWVEESRLSTAGLL